MVGLLNTHFLSVIYFFYFFFPDILVNTNTFSLSAHTLMCFVSHPLNMCQCCTMCRLVTDPYKVLFFPASVTPLQQQPKDERTLVKLDRVIFFILFFKQSFLKGCAGHSHRLRTKDHKSLPPQCGISFNVFSSVLTETSGSQACGYPALD